MFSKFKVEKPSHVLHKRGARHFEAEKSSNILSLPMVESYDQQIRLMCAEIEQLKVMKSIDQGIIQFQVTELRLARAEAFQLRQEIQLLRDEVAHSRLQVHPVKNRVKFNVTRKTFWELEKSARSLKSQCRNISRISNQFRKIEFWFIPPKQPFGMVISENDIKKSPSALHLDNFRKVRKFTKKYNFYS